jgi:hypothetical protein
LTTKRRRHRGVTDRLLASGLVQTFGLDALLVVALTLVGASVYRLQPELVWGYAGLVVLAAWWAIGRSGPGTQKPN